MTRVLVAEKIGEPGVQLLRDAGIDVELGADWEAGELERRIGEFDGILIRSATKLTADLIKKADNLKAVGRAGVTAPPDQGARDRIAQDLSTTLFVEAGAGSGKTTALVARVVALVASGTVELRHLAAITFTEKAGAELRQAQHDLHEADTLEAVLTADRDARTAAAAAIGRLTASSVETAA